MTEDAPATVDLAALWEPTEVRIVHIWGHGAWHPLSRAEGLRTWVDDGNARYGAGSHWLEFR